MLHTNTVFPRTLELLNELIGVENNIRLVSIPDIGAMKLAAITGRGRRRDFIDLFFILKKYSLKDLIAYYNQKYPDGSEFLVVRSLTYFDDAENDEMPNMIEPYDWTEIKETIKNEVSKLYF